MESWVVWEDVATNTQSSLDGMEGRARDRTRKTDDAIP